MEAVSWSDVRQAALPQLRITEETPRRDSITSSRTADSGYISDPEISLSPLEFQPEECLVSCDRYTSLRPSPFIPRKTQKRDPKLMVTNPARNILITSQKARVEVTSNPSIVTCAELENKSDWIKAFKCHLDTSSKESRNDLKIYDQAHLAGIDDVHHWIGESKSSGNRPKERVSSIVSISSSGSGGNYSITDDSEYEDVADKRSAMLSKATLATIDLIMRKIEINLNFAAYVQNGGSKSSKSNAPSDISGRRNSSAQVTSGKRKGRFDEGLQPDNFDEDGPNKRRRVSVTTTEDSETGPRFACPFYKHDSSRYRNRRTCPGPGWPTVHRMKEHLYRSHAQPIFCPRCYTMFDADSDLSNHLRSEPCHMSLPQPIEGIDRETLKSLRKRSPALRLEEDKWRDTYQLLFPDVSELDIPSPYYDGDSPSEESRRFRRALLERVRQELFSTAEREDGAVEQNMLRQVAAIIQRCERELLDDFFQAPSLPQPQPPEGAAHLDWTANNLPPSNGVSTQAPTQAQIRHGLQQSRGNVVENAMHFDSAASSFPSIGLVSPQARIQAQPRLALPQSHGNVTSAPPVTEQHIHVDTSRPFERHSHLVPTQGGPSLQGSHTHIPEPLAQFSAPPWDSSEWIDWNAVFPPGPSETQGYEHSGEQAVTFSAPVYT